MTRLSHQNKKGKRTLETIQPFDNDIKRLKKKHYDINKIREPLQALIENDVDLLKTKYSDHELTGDWKGFRELHVESDLLLIYYVDNDVVSLVLVRLNSHDVLFSNREVPRKTIKSYLRARRKDF